MKTRKFLAGAVAMGILGSAMVGCGSTNKAQETTADGTPIQTFSVFFADSNPNADDFQSPVSQKILEMTGVKLDIEYTISVDE